MERRAGLRQPIRLRVTFRSVRALIAEYTTSVSKGGCTIASPAAVEPGTMFVFELASEGTTRRALEVEGRVVHCTPRTDASGYSVGIEYVANSSPRRVAMSRFLDEVFAEQLANRQHARVPVNLIAQDVYEPEIRYLVRDLSRGGMGLRLPSERQLSTGLHLDQQVEITVRHDGDTPFVMLGRVVRLVQAEPPRQASIGIRFENLSEANQRLVDALLYLHRPEAILVRFFAERP
ncbi:MAG: PilZ domain-containing protein [Myxococcales bacterium]